MTTKKRRNRFRTVVYQGGLVKILLSEAKSRCFYCNRKVFPFSDSYKYIERKTERYFERYNAKEIDYDDYIYLSDHQRLSKMWKQKHRLNMATVDHKTSIKNGGSDEKKNLVISCVSCNSKKGSKGLKLDPDTGLVTKL